MKVPGSLIACLAFAALAASCGPQSAQAAQAPAGPAADADPVIKELGKLVGGTWIARLGPNKDYIVDGKAEWTAHGRALRWTGAIGSGRPDSIQIASMMGWDPIKKRVYYLDSHGHDTVYKGSVRKDGDKLVYEFETIVGPDGKWKNEQTMPDKDTLHSQLWQWREGKWVKAGEEGITFMRETSTEQKAHFIYLIHPAREGFIEHSTPEEQKTVGEHFRYLQSAVKEGKVVMAGRVLEAPWTGLVIFEAKDRADAEAFMNGDPAVKAKVFKAVSHPFGLALLR
jgi:uncharacterized protein YciI